MPLHRLPHLHFCSIFTPVFILSFHLSIWFTTFTVEAAMLDIVLIKLWEGASQCCLSEIASAWGWTQRPTINSFFSFLKPSMGPSKLYSILEHMCFQIRSLRTAFLFHLDFHLFSDISALFWTPWYCRFHLFLARLHFLYISYIIHNIGKHRIWDSYNGSYETVRSSGIWRNTWRCLIR